MENGIQLKSSTPGREESGRNRYAEMENGINERRTLDVVRSEFSLLKEQLDALTAQLATGNEKALQLNGAARDIANKLGRVLQAEIDNKATKLRGLEEEIATLDPTKH